MKYNALILAVLFACSSCGVHKGRFAKKAEPKDFQGTWSGEHEKRAILLTIRNSESKVENFPVTGATGGPTRYVTSKVEASFEEEYGQNSSPCILLRAAEIPVVEPLFLSKDKQELLYFFDPTRDKWIFLKKQKEK